MKEMWLARDKNDSLWLFFDEKPEKGEAQWGIWVDQCVEMDSSLFPEIKWTDEEPTKAKLVLDI